MNKQVENVMGTQRMSRLVLSTGVPLMMSLLISSLYNFVDSVFVSRVSEDALAAVSLAAPVQMMISALGLGNAIGLNAVISKALGEKRPDKVRKAADASIFIGICAWILISISCLLFVKQYFSWQSEGNEVIARYGRQYITICMLFSFGQMGQWIFDRFVIASGKSSLFLFTLSAASITNLILDPIFIFGLFGLPRMETLGAAIATVIGQIVGMIAGVIINRRWNREIPFGFPFHPDFDSVLAILKVGIPSTFVQMMTAGVNVVINSLLITFSSTAIAVYGVCTRIFNVVSVGVHGINNGLIPIVAYNFGAKKIDRIREAVKWAVIDSVAIYFLFLSVLQISPNIIMRLFDASDYMMMIGIPALRILSIAWLLTIPNLVCGAALQGLSFGMKSMYLNLIRQAILPVSFALIFSSVGILNLVWLGFVLSEILCFPIALMLWKKAFHNLSPCSF